MPPQAVESAVTTPLEQTINGVEGMLYMFSSSTNTGFATINVVFEIGRERLAVAAGVVYMQPETLRLIRDGAIKKGDVLTVARLAGIMAAKRTHELIPLCHPLPLDGITVDINKRGSRLVVRATVRCTGKTGVEMEALTAASVAALTIYDMGKAASHDIVIGPVRLMSKSGGRRNFSRRTVRAKTAGAARRKAGT